VIERRAALKAAPGLQFWPTRENSWKWKWSPLPSCRARWCRVEISWAGQGSLGRSARGRCRQRTWAIPTALPLAP